jgi:hypothetical protein
VVVIRGIGGFQLRCILMPFLCSTEDFQNALGADWLDEIWKNNCILGAEISILEGIICAFCQNFEYT